MPFLIRFWINPSGKLSLRHYRIFLFIYFLFMIPLFTTVFLAFLVIGYRGPEGVFRSDTMPRVLIMTFIYAFLCLWPLAVASLKRMHDLNLRGRDYFFSFNPMRNFKLGLSLMREKGQLEDN